MKKLLLLLLCVPLIGLGQCISGDCINGKGVKIYDNGVKYDGAFQNSLRHGYGIFYLENKKIDGFFRNDLYVRCLSGDCYNGQGTAIVIFNHLGMEDMYIGEFLDGLMNGRGNLHYSNTDKYIGLFQKGRKHGKGVLFTKNKTYNIGQWNLDIPIKDSMQSIRAECIGNCFDGSGYLTVYYHSDKIEYTYEGEFLDGKKDGYGKYTSEGWFFYIGEWKNDKRHGKLLWTNLEGDTLYNGEWKNNERHGYGIDRIGDYGFQKGSLEKYEGYFRKGRKHGKGKKTFESGNTLEVLWEYGEWVGNCLSGNCFSGKSTAEYFHEFGDFKYIGEFKEGLWEVGGDFISNDETRWKTETFIGIWGERKSFTDHWLDE